VFPAESGYRFDLHSFLFFIPNAEGGRFKLSAFRVSVFTQNRFPLEQDYDACSIRAAVL